MEISNKDILLAFLYFNVSCLRLQNKPLNVEKESINPNLLKLFLRHYGEFAKKNSLDVQSDDEDYVIPVIKPQNEGEISLSNLTPNIRPPPAAPKQHKPKKNADSNFNAVGKKVDIFAVDESTQGTIKISDLKNKFEFPSLGEEAPKKPAETQPSKAGWSKGGNDFYLYDKGLLSKKEMEEEFPNLDGPPKKPNNLGKNQSSGSEKMKTPVLSAATSNQGPPLISAPIAGGFDWLEMAKKETLNKAINGSGVTIQKAPSKKKKK